MNVIKRVAAPTPKFFRILRSVGLVLFGISGSVIAAPVVLPAVVVSVAGYLAVVGGVLSAVSQMTVDPSTGSEQEDTLKQVQGENLGADPEINSR